VKIFGIKLASNSLIFAHDRLSFLKNPSILLQPFVFDIVILPWRKFS